MPALQTQPVIMTLEDYEALPEDRRAEIFDGQIYDMASPSQSHQAIRRMIISVSYIIIKMPESVSIGS